MPDEYIKSMCTYMRHVHKSEAEIVAQARTKLNRAGVNCDTFVGTGLSGALIVPTLARALSKHWLIVRKPGENSHTAFPAEGTLGRRWLFVDDLISTGATLERVKAGVQKAVEWVGEEGFSTEYVGDYLYTDCVVNLYTERAPECDQVTLDFADATV